MTPTNVRDKSAFADKGGAADHDREFTFDELSVVGGLVVTIAVAAYNRGEPFAAQSVLNFVVNAFELPRPERYARAVLDLLNRLVLAGQLTQVHAEPSAHGERMPRRLYSLLAVPRNTDWLKVAMGAHAQGIPYVAHVFGDITVRVHVKKKGTDLIASGIVIGKDRILTAAHVVRGASDVAVSFGTHDPTPAVGVLLPACGVDLAIVHADGFVPVPYPWMREPRPAEPVVVLAYPVVPQLNGRPLLRFAGHVATAERVSTYFGHELDVVSAVMGPGASGGPVFSADGYLIGMVIEHLAGTYAPEAGKTLESIFHAVMPSGVLLRDIPKVDASLSSINTWG